MLPLKIDLTKELVVMLRKLRMDHPVNGEILTAENLSKTIGNNRAWMSQIESRRLKRIKREDIIAIYKLLYNETDDYEAEYRAEIELESYYTNIDKSIPLSFDEKLEDKLNNEYTNSETDDFYNRKSFSLIIENTTEILSDKFNDITDTNEQGKFLRLISLFCNYVSYAYQDAKLFIDKLPLELLQYATPEEREYILNELDVISNKLNSFEIRYIEKRFIDRVNEHNTNPLLKKQGKESLLFGLIELSKLIDNQDSIHGSIIDYINNFSDLVKKYYLCKNIPIPVIPPELDNNSNKQEWLGVIDKLQVLLSDTEDSNFFLRGRLNNNNNLSQQ